MIAVLACVDGDAMMTAMLVLLLSFGSLMFGGILLLGGLVWRNPPSERMLRDGAIANAVAAVLFAGWAVSRGADLVEWLPLAALGLLMAGALGLPKLRFRSRDLPSLGPIAPAPTSARPPVRGPTRPRPPRRSLRARGPSRGATRRAVRSSRTH
jgi:hypothetical protein